MRILLVEDHEVVRIGLRQLIDSHPDLTVCGEATSVAAARAAIDLLRPDVVLLDITLGEESGLDLLRGLEGLAYFPRVLVLSMFDEALYADDALALGARGYTMKDVPPDDLIRAIRTVASGAVHLSDRLTQRVMRRVAAGREQGPAAHEALTPREQEVIVLLGEGRTTREIAAHLGTAVKTVDSHKRNICEKLGLDSAAELLRYAVVNAQKRSRE
ncbi:MAG: response regulator transcription factor [Proteobacteria bacterium]|nr:response regulator transcription factor [Pseudomonadota bacterium]